MEKVNFSQFDVMGENFGRIGGECDVTCLSLFSPISRAEPWFIHDPIIQFRGETLSFTDSANFINLFHHFLPYQYNQNVTNNKITWLLAVTEVKNGR